MLKSVFRLRTLILLPGALLLLHVGYSWFKVSRGLARDAWDAPSIVYGRPATLRVGDDVRNLRLAERLKRLSYRKVTGTPKTEGTYSEEAGRIRIRTRGFRFEDEEHRGFLAEVGVGEGRISTLATSAGTPLENVRLEPEEVARILGPKMEARRLVPLSAIPVHLQNAVLAAEDARFYSHFGIDLIGVGRAVWTNLRERRFAQGGSTVTQQLARNFFLTPVKSIGRKIREAELALLIETRYSKREILEAYLNKIYFGQEGPRGIFGVEEASRYYFSKGVGDLSLEEGALLAALIRSPNRYSPLRMPAAAKERRNWVLARMARLGMIDRVSHRRAEASPVRTNPRRASVRLAEYFVDYVQRASEDVFGGGNPARSGFRFHTSVDPVHQAAAEAAVAEGLPEVENAAARDDEPLEAALVAVDPATGELTALVGGRGYAETQFNRAADAFRQPGSAFKPFVLLAAMEQAAKGKGKVTLAGPVSGEPVTVDTKAGAWTPANFEGKPYGTITVRKMIEESVNTAAVRLAMDVGLPQVVAAAREAGIESPISPVPSAALGSFEVTPVELAYAYTTLASGGTRFRPFVLHSVEGPDGGTLFTGKASSEKTVDPRAAYLVTYALQGVFDRGTARSARDAGVLFPAAGKTGTTDDYRDSWFVGYTPDVVCAVWVGRDSGKATGLSGAQGALKIWTRFMKALYPSAGPAAFAAPPGIVTAVIDPQSGYLATAACPEILTEAFLDGTAPTEPCPLHPAHPLVDSIRKGVRGLGDILRNLFR